MSTELCVRERKRLEVVWQRGMSTNCTLCRSNRITPIYTLLNYMCLPLGDQFGPLIDQFWIRKIIKTVSSKVRWSDSTPSSANA
jgi:hypothetical protein